VALHIQTVVAELITNSGRANPRHLYPIIGVHLTRNSLAAGDDAPGDPIKRPAHAEHRPRPWPADRAGPVGSLGVRREVP
jgi:hypothetical protein